MTLPNNGSLTAAASTVPTQDTPLTNDDYLSILVGEGKKYSTPQELAKAYIHADRRIKELDETVSDAKEHERLFNEILTELRSKTTPNSAQEPPVTSTQQPPSGQITTDSVEQLVETKLSQREMEREAKKNQELAVQKMAETYKTDSNGALRIIAEISKSKPELNDVLDKLGNTDPDAFVKFVTTLKPVTAVQSNTPGATGGPSAASIVAANGGLTWTQARKVRKEDPKLYNSREFRASLEKAAAAAEARGVDFYQT